MKRTILFLLTLCLCMCAFGGGAPGEAAGTAMTGEELVQAGKDATAKGDYAKALEYYRQAIELGDQEAAENLQKLTEMGYIQE